MREYVEKVATIQKGEDNKGNSVAPKNDMGGTASNIVKGGEGDTKGPAQTPKKIAGNVNVTAVKHQNHAPNAKAVDKVQKGADTDS